MITYNPHCYWVIKFVSSRGLQHIKTLDQPELAEWVWQVMTNKVPEHPDLSPEEQVILSEVGLWDIHRKRWLSIDGIKIHIYTALKNYGLRNFTFIPNGEYSMFEILWKCLKNPQQAKQSLIFAPLTWRQWWQKMGIFAPAQLIPPHLFFNPVLDPNLGKDLPYAERFEHEVQDLVLNSAVREEQLPDHYDFYTPSAYKAFPPGQRVLWVTSPDYQIEMPILLRPEEQWPPKQSEALSPSEKVLWRAAHLMYSPQIADPYPQLTEDLNREKYCVLRKVISAHTLGALRNYYQQKYLAGHFQLSDEFVSHRDSIHNEPLMMVIHQQLARAVNRLVPEAIKTSYCYLAIYREGAVLPRHIDRELCRWNLSVVLNLEPEAQGEEVWPIYLEIEPDQPRAVHLEIGDGVLYQGTDYYHWRDALPKGQQALVCFFHFVPAGYQGFLY